MGTSVPVYPASTCAPRARTFRGALIDTLLHLLARLRLWRERSRRRRQLAAVFAAMSERDFNDLCVPFSSIEYEANKPFWWE